jgi:hypothetical protein
MWKNVEQNTVLVRIGRLKKTRMIGAVALTGLNEKDIVVIHKCFTI